MVDRQRRDVVAARQRIVHQRRVQPLTGGVVADLREQRVLETQRDGAVDLTLDDGGLIRRPLSWLIQ